MADLDSVLQSEPRTKTPLIRRIVSALIELAVKMLDLDGADDEEVGHVTVCGRRREYARILPT